MRMAKGELLATIEKMSAINKDLAEKISTLLPELQPIKNRITVLERSIRGSPEESGILFRLTLLERLIKLPTHVRPVTKKQMAVIRKMIKEGVVDH